MDEGNKTMNPITELSLFKVEQKMGEVIHDSISNVLSEVFDSALQSMFFQIAEIPEAKQMYKMLYGWEIETREEYQAQCWNNLFKD